MSRISDMRFAVAFAVCACVLSPVTATADEKAVADFYSGKTFSVSVGFSPGGTFDLYARVLARHIGQYIPGKPTVIVQHLPGAGGRRIANVFQNVGPHDGTVIGITTPGIVTDQVMHTEGVQYDLRKFHWIGSPADEVNVLWVWHTAPIKTLEDAKRHEVSLSSTGQGAPNYFVPRIMNQLLGTKFKVITGYPGATEADLAIERGEVSGRVSGWTNVKTTSDWMPAGKARILVQIGLRKIPELPSIPLMPELGRNDTERQVFEFLSIGPAMGRPFFMPPNTPPERAAAIRKAFDMTIKDPTFVEEIKRAKFDVSPVSGDELRSLVLKSFDIRPDVLATAKKAME